MPAWLVALLVLVLSVVDPAPGSSAGDPALRIAVVGDSMSCGGLADTPGWCPELSRLLAGVDHELLPLAVGGTRCDYWAAHIDDVLAEHEPDLVILGCGHNDAAARLSATQTQAAVEAVAAAVHAAGARLLIGRSHYASGTPASWEPRPWLPAAIHTTNSAVVGAWSGFASAYGPAFSPAMYDDTRVPPLSRFVLGDGVHPTAEGYRVLAHNRYRALAGFITGLPPIPPDCMQIGHPPGQPIPRGIPCYGSPPRGGV